MTLADGEEVSRLRAENVRLREALREMYRVFGQVIDQHGVEHEGDCPEDDTCLCLDAAEINTAFTSAIAALRKTEGSTSQGGGE